MNHNESSDAKLLLVVKDQLRGKNYLDALNEHGAVCRIVSTLQEAITIASEKPHCGILVDMQLMLRIPTLKRVGVEDLLNGLPSATLNINVSRGEIRILPRGSMAFGCSSLHQFISICANFAPKIIFQRTREPIHYNVLLDVNPEFSSPCRTVCIDISSGGCFVFCCNGSFVSGDSVWIKMPDIVCDVPIKATVCWVREWGATQKIPGIGVCFDNQQ
jgi:hypothetical protein